MKLKFRNPVGGVALHEADENAGKRVIYIENVIKALKPAVESAKYKFKADGDVTKGFHILPANKFLGKITFTVNEGSGKVDVKLVNCKNELVELTKDGCKNSIDLHAAVQTADQAARDTETAVLAADIQALLTACNTAIVSDSLGESLNESVNLLEYGPFGNLKATMSNFFSKQAAKAADKRDERQQKANQAVDFSAFTEEMVTPQLNALIEGKGLKLDSKIGKTSAEYAIVPETNTILSVSLTSTDDYVSLRVKQILNASGAKVEIGNGALADVLKKIGAALGIDTAAAAKAAGAEINDAEDNNNNNDSDSADDTSGSEGSEDTGDSDEITMDDVDAVFGSNKVSVSDFKSKYKGRGDALSGMDENDLRALLGRVEGLQPETLKVLGKDTLAQIALDLIK